MKRDMDVVRRIALASEKLQSGQKLRQLENLEQVLFNEHVLWMMQANLVQARVHADEKDAIVSAHVIRLTWEGCEFADAARSETIWEKAKQDIFKPTASLTFGVLKDWLVTEIRNGLPTLMG